MDNEVTRKFTVSHYYSFQAMHVTETGIWQKDILDTALLSTSCGRYKIKLGDNLNALNI